MPCDDKACRRCSRRCYDDFDFLYRVRVDLVAQVPESLDMIVRCKVRAVEKLECGKSPVALHHDLLVLFINRDQPLARVKAAEVHDRFCEAKHVFVFDKRRDDVPSRSLVGNPRDARIHLVEFETSDLPNVRSSNWIGP